MAAPAPTASPLFAQFVDDELMRAPMLFDQVVEGMLDGSRRNLAGLNNLQRGQLADLMQAVQAQRPRMADYYGHSLRKQLEEERRREAQAAPHAALAAPARPKALALVDEDEVAIEVELSHAIELVKSTAEYELRELQTFVAALVGDFDMSADHNPFRPATYARAVWAAAQALPLSRGHQVLFMRQCAEPLAQVLRQAFAATASRLESWGVEPAAYRTLILPSGSRRGPRSVLSTFSPDLQRMRETMPAPLDTVQARPPMPLARAGAAPMEHWVDVARGTTQRADRQSVELVSRLFEAMLADERLPGDLALLISRLHGPAMRLALRDRSLLDQETHPLWRFIEQLVFVAGMSPQGGDPERQQLLRTAQATVEQLASEPQQHLGLHRWALERLDTYLAQRLKRRLATLASQVGALQKAERLLAQGSAGPSTMNGTLDAHQLDTVPAEFMDSSMAPAEGQPPAAQWLSQLSVGAWIRLFLQGQWRQAQLLWRAEGGELLLFGDGASDQTWAVRDRALARLHGHGLAKTLRVRSLVAAAARRVQEEVASDAAA